MIWLGVIKYTGEGNGTPLQYSCLENPTDGGAWWAAVHGIAKNRTRLSDFTFTFHFHALEKELATNSSVLAWRIPGTGEPGGLPSMGSHRVGHDWSDSSSSSSVFSVNPKFPNCPSYPFLLLATISLFLCLWIYITIFFKDWIRRLGNWRLLVITTRVQLERQDRWGRWVPAIQGERSSGCYDWLSVGGEEGEGFGMTVWHRWVEKGGATHEQLINQSQYIITN